MSSEMWHIANENSLEEERGAGLEMWHIRGLIDRKGGRGRNAFVSSETWQVTNKDSLPGGEEEGGRGRRAFVSSETWHVTNEDSPNGGEGEGGAHS